MTATVKGMVKWGGKQDKDGYIDINATWLVRTSAATVGPIEVFTATGLPTVGTPWPEHPWCFCSPEMTATPRLQGEPNTVWEVEQLYTNRPLKRCQDTQIEDPLDEPPRIGGSFIKYTEEATVNRLGQPIRSSSWELIRGASAERDNNRPTVMIGMNFGSNQLSTFAPMIDTVNDSTLWGLGARKIKLMNAPWRQLLYGTCSYYYTVDYEFEINYRGWDRRVIDEGTRILRCGGNKNNPADFIAFKDALGENHRVILDGDGNLWDGTGDPGYVDIEFYGESNFLLLGIPTSL
jgi:hypothetical protein